MLKEPIRTNLNQAVKENNELVRTTLRIVLAVILNKEKDKRYKIKKQDSKVSEQELDKKTILTDEELIGIISSEIKKRKEAISEYEKGQRKDLAEKEKAEIEILQKYLPEQLSEQEVKKIIQESVEKVKAQEIKDLGKVMSELTPRIKGKTDMGEVSKIVKELLSK